MVRMMNDGGSASYYELPKGVTELQDLIEHREMSYAVGNMFKAIYRLGGDHHSARARDLKKILWFANRELARIADSPDDQ